MAYVKNLDIGALNLIYGAALTDKQREFIRLYYDCDISLSEISQMYDISRQAVRDAILRGEKELIRLDTALGFRQVIEGIEKVCERMQNAECKMQNCGGELIQRIASPCGETNDE